MVEGQRPGSVTGIRDDGRPGVVGAFRGAGRPGQEDRRDGVETRVPGRIGIGAELADELDIERRLFAGFAHGRGFERLAVVDKAPRQGPARRRVPPLDQDDAPDPASGHDLDDDVDRRERIAELSAGHAGTAFRAILGAALPPCQPGLFMKTPHSEVQIRREETSPVSLPLSSAGDGFRRAPSGSQGEPLARNLLI